MGVGVLTHLNPFRPPPSPVRIRPPSRKFVATPLTTLCIHLAIRAPIALQFCQIVHHLHSLQLELSPRRIHLVRNVGRVESGLPHQTLCSDECIIFKLAATVPEASTRYSRWGPSYHSKVGLDPVQQHEAPDIAVPIHQINRYILTNAGGSVVT